MNNKNTALLVMDVQPGIVDRFDDHDNYIDNVQKAVDHAHANNILVIYVVVSFRDGFPEISDHNKSFSSTKKSNPEHFIKVKPIIKRLPGDLLTHKHRISAFAGSDLDMLLRSNHIHHIVLAGISTSGVVLSTVREAADKDYQITVIEDLCLDSDPEVHEVLMTKLFPKQADVIGVNEFITK